jgi:hypothetical protein
VIDRQGIFCSECAMTAPASARGWKAEIGDDPRDDDAPEVVMFCPECWHREFGAPVTHPEI